MPSLKTIRTRIQSVRSTQKITRAMKMVAGARLARAQQRGLALRPYEQKTGEALRQVMRALLHQEMPSSDLHVSSHPLLRERSEGKALFVLLTSDRGLCGGFHSTLYKLLEQHLQQKKEEGVEVLFCPIGRKGRTFVEQRGFPTHHAQAGGSEHMDLAQAKALSTWMLQGYVDGQWDTISLVYNEYKSTLHQIPSVQRLFPVDLRARRPQSLTSTYAMDQPLTASQVFFGVEEVLPDTYLYEPSQEILFENLLSMSLAVSLYRALLESYASELSARMTAMDAATRNANDMIGRLTLMYNRARQATITKELIEILGGAEALRS